MPTSKFFNRRSAFDIRKSIKYLVSSIKTLQETRAENQETRPYSVEIRDSNVLRIFHFDILHSALDIRHWFQFRISYLVLPISTSYFLPGTLYFPSPFNTLRSAFDVGLDSVFRISYFLFLLCTSYLVPRTLYFSVYTFSTHSTPVSFQARSRAEASTASHTFCVSKASLNVG